MNTIRKRNNLDKIGDYIDEHAWTWWAFAAAFWSVIFTAWEVFK